MSLVSDSLANSLCLLTDGQTDPQQTQKWAAFFQSSFACPVNPPNPQDFFFHFCLQNGQVFVLDKENRRLEIDFDGNHLDYRRKGHRGKNELVAKALGAAKGCRKVLDLSVGLAIDSVFLTQLGFHMSGVERSPILYALLSEALARTQQESLKSYELFFADSFEFLKTQRDRLQFDALYFDPMYPHKKKSALPKQEMMVFRDLVGHDEDATRVLEEALKWPVRRVVVKRPIHAEVLLSGVSHSYEGKVVRYDTYVVG